MGKKYKKFSEKMQKINLRIELDPADHQRLKQLKAALILKGDGRKTLADIAREIITDHLDESPVLREAQKILSS